MGVTLPELAGLLGLDPCSVPPVTITGITCDSRRVKTGYLFTALRGRTHDGHAFIADACARGAHAVVAEVLPQPLPVPCLLVPDTRYALALLAARFHGHPSRTLEVVGITGTNGKTTSACLLEAILQAAGYPAGLIGTVAVRYGSLTFTSSLTTPGADELQEHLAAMRAAGLRYVVMEVSSQGIKTHRVTGTHFSFGVLTNVTLDHLDTHASFYEYMEAKKRFLEMLAPDRTVFVNLDDVGSRALLPALRAHIVTYGRHPAANLRVTQVGATASGSHFTLEVPVPVPTHRLTLEPLSLPLKLQVLGLHNMLNAAAAAGIALALGVPPQVVQEALAAFPGVERRLQVYFLDKLTVVDDTALNPASFDAVFAAVTALPYRRLLLVYALRGGRGPAVNRANALALAHWAHRLGFSAFITTSSVSHVGPADHVSPAEQAAFFSGLATAGLTPLHFPDLKDALAAALDKARPGDLLLLLGAQGMDAGRALLLGLAAQRRAAVLVPPHPAEVALV